MQPNTFFRKIAPLIWECEGFPIYRIYRLKYSDSYMLKMLNKSGFWMLLKFGTFEQCRQEFLKLEGINEKKI